MQIRDGVLSRRGFAFGVLALVFLAALSRADLLVHNGKRNGTYYAGVMEFGRTHFIALAESGQKPLSGVSFWSSVQNFFRFFRTVSARIRLNR